MVDASTAALLTRNSQMLADARMESAALTARAANERLSEADYRDWWTSRTVILAAEIDRAVRSGRISMAIENVLIELAACAVGARTRRLALEDRVANLEAAAKPRVRIRAPSRLAT